MPARALYPQNKAFERYEIKAPARFQISHAEKGNKNQKSELIISQTEKWLITRLFVVNR